MYSLLDIQFSFTDCHLQCSLIHLPDTILFKQQVSLMLMLLLMLIIVLPMGIMCVCSTLIEGWYLAMLMTGSCPFLIENLLQSSGWHLLKAPLSQVEIHWSQLEIVLSGIISESMQIPACFCMVSDLIRSYACG